MGVVIRVTARTVQRAFTCDFYRKRGMFTLQDLAPGLKNLRVLHRRWSFSDRTKTVRSVSALPGCKPRRRDGGTDSPSQQFRSLQQSVCHGMSLLCSTACDDSGIDVNQDFHFSIPSHKPVCIASTWKYNAPIGNRYRQFISGKEKRALRHRRSALFLRGKQIGFVLAHAGAAVGGCRSGAGFHAEHAFGCGNGYERAIAACADNREIALG